MRSCRRLSKRTLLVLGVFIVGGAVINIAVAWGCALWVNATYGEMLPRDDVVRILNDKFGHHDWDTPVGGVDHGASTWRRFVVAIEKDGTATMAIHECAAGLPMLALRGSVRAQEQTRDAETAWFLEPSLSQQLHSMSPGLIPYGPVWPGFAINTIFYAAMLWMVFTAPGFVRRRIRIMRHRCPACGYLIGTSPVCTECGTPLRIQKS